MADRLCNNTARLDAELSLEELSLQHPAQERSAAPEVTHDLQLHNGLCDELDVECCAGLRGSLEGEPELCQMEPEYAAAHATEPGTELEQELLQETEGEAPNDPGSGRSAPGLASLRGRRYGGTVFDKLISFLADLIKLLEIRLLRALYRRRDERLVLKAQALAQRDAEMQQDPLYKPKKRRRFARAER